MYPIRFLCKLLLCCLLSPVLFFYAQPSFEGITSFANRCTAVPEFPHHFQKSLITLQEFEDTCVEHARVAHNLLTTQSHWIDNLTPDKQLFNVHRTEELCMPFVQRLLVPNNTTIALFGDLHGSIHSLMRHLQTLKKLGYLDDSGKIINNAFRMLFLGDFVDRGFYGVEVTYVLLQLKILNPHKVFLLRGNHEDTSINALYQDKGFQGELRHKFRKTLSCSWYDLFPCALYLGSATSATTNAYVLCCHGGLEIGFDPRELLDAPSNSKLTSQWIHALQRNTALINVKNPPIVSAIKDNVPAHECADNIKPIPTTLGFLWSDFLLYDPYTENEMRVIDYTQGRGWVFGKPLTQLLLEQHSTKKSQLCGIIRAHQHHGAMLTRLKLHHGVAPLWNNLVHTLLSGASVAQDLSSCGFALLTTAPCYAQWSLKPVHTN